MNAARTALVIAGYQHGLFDPKSKLRDCLAEPSEISRVRETIASLITSSKLNWTSVAHVAICLDAGCSPDERGLVESVLSEHQLLEPGTSGANVLPILSEGSNPATLLNAARGSNAFGGSDLDYFLSSRQLSRIAIVAPTFGGILHATCNTAYALGYDITIPSDCLLASSSIELSIYLHEVLGNLAHVVTSSELAETHQ